MTHSRLARLLITLDLFASLSLQPDSLRRRDALKTLDDSLDDEAMLFDNLRLCCWRNLKRTSTNDPAVLLIDGDERVATDLTAILLMSGALTVKSADEESERCTGSLNSSDTTTSLWSKLVAMVDLMSAMMLTSEVGAPACFGEPNIP